MNPELRIGDAEREAAVDALGEHFAAGRLDNEEYDERASAAWAARTAGDLTALFGDLPTPHPPATAATETPGGKVVGPNTPSAHRSAWPPLASVPVLVVLVVLVVTTRLPWFLLAIFGWLLLVRSIRVRGHRSRHRTWHDQDPD